MELVLGGCRDLCDPDLGVSPGEWPSGGPTCHDCKVAAAGMQWTRRGPSVPGHFKGWSIAARWQAVSVGGYY